MRSKGALVNSTEATRVTAGHMQTDSARASLSPRLGLNGASVMSELEWYHRKDKVLVQSTYALVYLSEKSELYNSMLLVPPWSAGRKKAIQGVTSPRHENGW